MEMEMKMKMTITMTVIIVVDAIAITINTVIINNVSDSSHEIGWSRLYMSIMRFSGCVWRSLIFTFSVECLRIFTGEY